MDADSVTVALDDGRALSVPIAWSPRLLYGTPEERSDVEADPSGVHWPLLNESFSLDGMLAGHPSAEGPSSLAAWQALMERRRVQRARGDDPEPHYPTLPLPDWWDDEAPAVVRTT